MNNRGPAGAASRAYARAAGRGARTTAARPVRAVPAAGPHPCEGHGAWVFQAENALGQASGAGLTLAPLAVCALRLLRRPCSWAPFSAPPACLRDLIEARHRASSQCCPWSGWWAPSLSADEGG